MTWRTTWQDEGRRRFHPHGSTRRARGLGNCSYLAELGDGRAMAVDPGRDPAPWLEPPGRPTLMCARGPRAMTAASVLTRAGRPDARVLLGGAVAWQAVTGRSLAG